ncbi:DUF3307 domain-containing protein [Belliella kenyensis]|uniref:DUF3307 domain-containing protein n=1 Tax=Belliella kenyensis TaxID=1472724 RepID=A0ABV8ELU4_9BACT|nr:DUF3307 domain-containing protein [Belliella kenyensis]MCH7400447.1 DUF3307 domain-containing protein [Belliella kenyensis]MDN3604537.1 DUF3307 domain-containing protein [Belliella kenyensis]
MIIIIKLLLAHFLGDFALQPRSWVEQKEKRKAKSGKLYLHILIHGCIMMILLWDWSVWPMVLTLMLIHGVIDVLKLYAQKEKTKTSWFIIDQVLHLTSILAVWYIIYNPAIDLIYLFNKPMLWIYILAILIVSMVTGIMMQVFMHKWATHLEEGNGNSLKNAGKYIGILERLLVLTFIVIGRWEGVGFLLAAKSVFRFGDLKESKDRKLTEYILIGTLISFGIAIAVGLVLVQLQNIL